MEKIKNIVLCLCLVGIAISVLDLIAPGEKLKKQLRLLFSGVFILVMLSPFVNGNINIDIPAWSDFENSAETEQLTELVDGILKSEIEGEIRASLAEALSLSGIVANEILVSVNIEDNSCISITNVQILLSDESKLEEAKAVLTELIPPDECEIQISIASAEEGEGV